MLHIYCIRFHHCKSTVTNSFTFFKVFIEITFNSKRCNHPGSIGTYKKTLDAFVCTGERFSPLIYTSIPTPKGFFKYFYILFRTFETFYPYVPKVITFCFFKCRPQTPKVILKDFMHKNSFRFFLR